MNVYFYNITKRRNSTATPPGTPTPDNYDCKLKDACSILNPSILLNYSGYPTWNYFKIENRYYWITDIVSVKNDLWLISGTIDALATHKSHIQNTSAFVLYDSTANNEIPDSRLAIKTTPTISMNSATMPWNFASGTGTYFVAIEGDGDMVDQGFADSATGVYITTINSINKIGLDFDGTDVTDALNTAMMQQFPANIRLNTAWGYIDSAKDCFDAITDSIAANDIAGAIGYSLITWSITPWIFWSGLIGTIKGLFTGADALKHVKSAYWLPFDVNSIGTQKNRVAIGSFVDNIGTSRLVSDPIVSDSVQITIPWQYSDWRNVQNTEIQIYIPLIGVINIPSSAVKGLNIITCHFALNVFSGSLAVKLTADGGNITLGTYGSNVIMPILVGDSNPDIPAITNTIVAGASLAVGAATGTAALTMGAAGAFAQSGLGAIQPISTSVGGIGGGCGNALGPIIHCSTICHNTSQNPSSLLSTIGTPTNQLKTLSGSGYCQTMNAQLNCAAQTGEPNPTDTEIQIINAALNSGVYLE